MKGATLASIASTNGLAASMLVLNAAMRANPIGLIVTALALVGAAFVFAWKKSETFRAVVIKVVQAVMNAFSKLVEISGKFFSALGKVPGMGWAKAIGKGLDGISDKITTTSNKLALLQTGAMGIAARQDTAMAGRGPGSTGGTGGGTSGGGLDDKAKKKLADYKKDVAKIYKDINEVIADAQEKAQEELNDRNERMFEAHKDYDKRVADLNKRSRERNLAIDNAYNKKVIDIRKNYLKRTLELEKDLANKVADLRERAAEKSADLRKSAAEKELSIVQQSMDRLRDVFASQTGFNIDNVFGPGRSVKNALIVLKRNLTAAQELQANAGALAGMGYSQTFIEEVIKQGPKIGNNIAKSLKNATPESTAELQKLLLEVQNVSEHGLDGLAKSMNTGGKLATEELTKAYAQVAVDLKASLAGVDVELKKSLEDANAAYQEAMTEAQITRDEALQEAFEAFKEARAEAQKDLDEGLAEALETLQDALLEAQKDYEKAIDDINKSTMKKLTDLKDKLKEVAAEMAAISKGSAAGVVSGAPTYKPILAQSLPGGLSGKTDSASTVTNITQTFTTTRVDPEDVHLATLSAIKYGQAVTLPKNASISAKVRDM
jgi:hypothetical protein